MEQQRGENSSMRRGTNESTSSSETDSAGGARSQAQPLQHHHHHHHHHHEYQQPPYHQPYEHQQPPYHQPYEHLPQYPELHALEGGRGGGGGGLGGRGGSWVATPAAPVGEGFRRGRNELEGGGAIPTRFAVRVLEVKEERHNFYEATAAMAAGEEVGKKETTERPGVAAVAAAAAAAAAEAAAAGAAAAGAASAAAAAAAAPAAAAPPPAPVAPAAGAVKRGASGLVAQTRKKACDFCHKKKRKCDGDGFAACALCLSSNRECVYTRKGSKRTQEITTLEKRPRLTSPSLATGIVGTLESTFVSSYFEEMNCWLPYISEARFRDSLMKVICGMHATAAGGGSQSQLAQTGASPAPVDLVFIWSVIAFGASIRGMPVYEVIKYVEIARRAVGQCSDPSNKDHLRAKFLFAAVLDTVGQHEEYLLGIDECRTPLLLLDQQGEEVRDMICILRANDAGAVVFDGSEKATATEKIRKEYHVEGAVEDRTPSEAFIDAVFTLDEYALKQMSGEDELGLKKGMAAMGPLVEDIYQRSAACGANKASAARLEIYACLAHSFVAAGQIEKGMEWTRMALDTLEDNEGLIRVSHYQHGVHIMAYLALTMGNVGVYNRFRRVHNDVDFYLDKMPPAAEAKHHSICSNSFCLNILASYPLDGAM